MLRLLTLLAAITISGEALAQDVGPVECVGTVCTTQVQAADDLAVQNCLVPEGADHTDPVNHLLCQPVAGAGAISSHDVIVGVGTALNVRAISLNAEGGVSDPSPNRKLMFTSLPNPQPPVILD